MRVGPFLGAAAAIAAVPGLALVVLMGGGWLAPAPGLAALAATVAAATALAAVLARDLRLLTDTLRHAALESGEQPSPPAATPRFAPMERLALAIGRLARSLASRTGEISRLLRANEAIIEALPDPLLVLGEDRQPRRANAAARAAFGEDIPAVLRHPGMRAAIDRAFDTGTRQTVELSLPVPVARELHAAVILMDPPLPDGAWAIMVLSDRTHERALARMRSDFIANASHELRTPLASLIGFIDTLLGPAANDPPAQRRFLAIMAEQAGRMNRLIDDLLSLTRIEMSEHQAPSEPVDLAALVAWVVAGFEPAALAREATLELKAPEGLPLVIADADQIAQVAQNLIDNALKYGGHGGVVRVELAVPAPGGRWPARPGVVLSVADNGPGIPRQHVPRLTERFYRVDAGRSRKAGGTGLGLAIVRHIVNRHRGQLAIDSEEGKGSTFSVWLAAAER
jgi:two-component system, OmpR family, phosphate regulon sensor histidine kinase PhoR